MTYARVRRRPPREPAPIRGCRTGAPASAWRRFSLRRAAPQRDRTPELRRPSRPGCTRRSRRRGRCRSAHRGCRRWRRTGCEGRAPSSRRDVGPLDLRADLGPGRRAVLAGTVDRVDDDLRRRVRRRAEVVGVPAVRGYAVIRGDVRATGKNDRYEPVSLNVDGSKARPSRTASPACPARAAAGRRAGPWPRSARDVDDLRVRRDLRHQ